MLRLSKKTDYALISLSYVASRGNHPASAREIAERHDIPVELLAKVLQRLVQRGVLKSQQGIHGGYLLARPADTLTVAEVVEAIDGPLQLTVCGTTDERCEQFAKCSIRDPLHRIRDRFIKLRTRHLPGPTPSLGELVSKGIVTDHSILYKLGPKFLLEIPGFDSFEKSCFFQGFHAAG